MTQRERVNPQADQLLARIDSLDARVRRSQQDLDSASQLEMLGLLTGAIAHEFNNILTPILSYARVALDNPEDAELCRRALDRAALGAERASRIASSVLRLAGHQHNQVAETCRPSHALHAAISCLPKPLDAQSISLQVGLPDDLVVAMPQTDLEHVFLNLLLNSSRALSNSGGVIEVSCPNADESSTWNSEEPPQTVIEFRDSGPGIGAADRATIFEPFQRGNDSNPAQNHGLGLTICKQLVEASGGSIRLEPDTAQGAVFRILLPNARHTTAQSA